MIPDGLNLDTAASEEIVEKLVGSASYTQEEAEAVAAMLRPATSDTAPVDPQFSRVASAATVPTRDRAGDGDES